MKHRTVDTLVRQDRTEDATARPRRRVIAVGKRQDGGWKVRTSLWRYLAETALSR